MNFEFYTAGKIIFGNGKINMLGSIAKEYGKKALIVCGGSSLKANNTLTKIEDGLNLNGISYTYYSNVTDEPSPETITKGVDLAKANKSEFIISIGGGSVIDTGKAISGIATNKGNIIDYLEGVGIGLTIDNQPLPFIAVPTTSGTGSEVTKNAVITSLDDKFKKSLRSEKLIPNIALLDPELTISLPKKQTAASGLDALTQLIESYVSLKAQPIPKAISIYGIGLCKDALLDSYNDGTNILARENLMLASLLSGISLANSGLGAAHGIGAALGCFYGIPHGIACAILLPHVMKLNLAEKKEEFAEIGRVLTGKNYQTSSLAAQAGLDFIFDLAKKLGIPKDLKSYNINEFDLPELVKASRGSSMSGNPVLLDDDALFEFIKVLI